MHMNIHYVHMSETMTTVDRITLSMGIFTTQEGVLRSVRQCRLSLQWTAVERRAFNHAPLINVLAATESLSMLQWSSSRWSVLH